MNQMQKQKIFQITQYNCPLMLDGRNWEEVKNFVTDETF